MEGLYVPQAKPIEPRKKFSLPRPSAFSKPMLASLILEMRASMSTMQHAIAEFGQVGDSRHSMSI